MAKISKPKPKTTEQRRLVIKVLPGLKIQRIWEDKVASIKKMIKRSEYYLIRVESQDLSDDELLRVLSPHVETIKEFNDNQETYEKSIIANRNKKSKSVKLDDVNQKISDDDAVGPTE